MRRRYINKQKLIFPLIIILILTLIPKNSFTEKETYDIVIKNGTIFNPSTDHELSGYNLGIKDEKIIRITKDNISGDKEIDATGLIVSPGFIDLISYDPNSVGIKLKVLDGVTSNLAMHGGTEDAKTWYDTWEKNGVLTNFGASSFITRQRWPIVGYGVDAEMTNKKDIDKLVKSVRKNIEAGALGISFSFEYVPGVKNEVIPLLNLAKEYNIPTFYHLRYSDGEKGLEGIQEVIDYGKKTGAIIHIMHINSTGGTFHMEEALQMIKDAQENGLDITACVYPYDYWATYIDSARFRPGWQDRFKITYEDLQIGGTDIRITKDTFDKYRRQHLLVAAHGSMPEEELIMALKESDIMIGSDTIIEPSGNNHPRGAGTYSRIFGKYVREEKILSTMEAIKKVSYLPAKRMESSAPAMKYKGRIEVGSDADITIFNPETIIDKSTVKDTAAPSVGIEYVIINGVIVKDKDGIVNGVSPGKPIKSYFVDKIPENEPIKYSLKLDRKDEKSLSSVYEIDGQTYLSVEELFKYLNIPIEYNRDGNINIGNILNLEIGEKKAKFGDDEMVLDYEPIIYKSGVYMDSNDFKKILKSNYNVELSKDKIILEYVGTNGDVKQAFAYNTGDNKLKSNGNKKIYVGAYGFSIIVIGLVLVLFKKDNKQKNI